MEVGFIGTGTMGNPMVRCLLEAGHRVTVHDVRREATVELCQLGAVWAESPRLVAEASQVVFASLPGPAEVEQVALDPDSGVLAGIRRGGCYIDTTTNSPEVCRRVAEACGKQGVGMLDAPVSGRPPGMTIMAGGDAETFAKHLPLLECMGRNIFHVGGTGAGCVSKLVSQYLAYCGFVTAAEGLLIGAKAGVDLDMLAKVVPVSAGASRVFDAFPRSVFSGEFTASGTLDIVAKDVALACELARSVGVASEMGAVADGVFRLAQSQGLGGLGYPAAVQVLEQVAGVVLRSSHSGDGEGYQGEDPRRV